MKTLDRNQAIPISFQLQEIFHDHIEEGIWKSHDQIPTEKELCNQYQVSLITVRKALKQLELEGLIKRFQGKGTFVEDRKMKDLILQSLTGSFAFSEPSERNFSTVLVEKSLTSPNQNTMEVLNLNSGDRVIELVRIRNVDHVPLYWTRAFIPEKLCPDLLDENFESQSLYEILETKYKITAASAVRTMETVFASSRAQNYLGVPFGAPISLVSSISFLKDGSPIEYSKNYFRSDRVKFEVWIHS